MRPRDDGAPLRAQANVASSRCSESSRARPVSPSSPAATASLIAQSGASGRCVHPRGQSSAMRARSVNAPRMFAGSTWPSPKERTPGVSITHPVPPSPSSTRSEIVDDDVCRPRPVTSFTRPIARSAPGTSAFTSVDLPTPEWPTNDGAVPDQGAR